MSVEPARGGGAARWIIGLILAVVSAIGGRTCVLLSRPPPPTPAEILETLPSDPEFGPFATLVRDRFPEQWERLRTSLTGFDAGATDAQLHEAMSQEMRRFSLAHARDAARAPDASLVAVNRANAALLAALQNGDQSVCAAIADGGPPPNAVHPPAVARALQDLAVASLLAVREGIDHPVSRRPPSNDDQLRFVAEVRRQNATPETIALLEDRLQWSRAGEQVRCRSGLDLMRGIAALPADIQSRLRADIMMEVAESTPAPPEASAASSGPSASPSAPAERPR